MWREEPANGYKQVQTGRRQVHFLFGCLLLYSSLPHTRISTLLVQEVSLGDQLSLQLTSANLWLGAPPSSLAYHHPAPFASTSTMLLCRTPLQLPIGTILRRIISLHLFPQLVQVCRQPIPLEPALRGDFFSFFFLASKKNHPLEPKHQRSSVKSHFTIHIFRNKHFLIHCLLLVVFSECIKANIPARYRCSLPRHRELYLNCLLNCRTAREPATQKALFLISDS